MTNQQVPEALFYADALDRCAEVDFDHIFVPAAAEIRRLHAENERLAALVDAQQPATHVQNPAEIEHVAGDVSKNGTESNMAQQPAPSAAAAGQRRSDLVPGVMHCAKCKFQLNRITLCVSDGNAYAGNNETEPCPNGCGPLWPVTWEQEARNCWKALEEMHERLHPAPPPQADSQPSPSDEAILSAARNWGEVQQYNRTDGKGTEHRIVFNVHHRAAHFASELLAGRATADNQPAPTNTRQIAECYGDCPTDPKTCANPCKFEGRAARAPADNVLEDAARLDWLALAGPTSICLVIDRPHDGEVEVATDDVTGYGKTLREALDAARKQGGAA